MIKIATPHIMLITGVLLALLLGGVLITHHPAAILTDVSARLFTPVSATLHRAVAFGEIFTSRRDLVQENIRLTAELQAVQGQQARLAALNDENLSLKASLGIKDRLIHSPVQGGIFSYPSEGGVRQLVVNRGSQDGVGVGNVVITAEGALVGVVQEVSGRHATVRSLQDASMEVAARIMDSAVTGLVRVDATGGLILDLVQKSESVTEKEMVITSGNDQFPAGLMVGRVRSVDNESATLFKMVHLYPASGNQANGTVFILQP